MQELTDKEVVRGVIEGRRDAVDALVEDCYERVFSLAARLLQDHDTAKDVAQETFIRVLDKIGKFRFKSSLRTWVLSIAYNLCMNRLQSGAKTNELNVEHMDRPNENEDEANAKYLQEQRFQELEKAVQNLEPYERVIIELHYLNGCSIREIALVLQKSETAAKTALFRAREKLKTLVMTYKNYEFS